MRNSYTQQGRCRMDGAGTGNQIVGIYIDISGGTWKGAAICIVEETPSGRLVVMDANDPDMVRVIATQIDGPQLEEVMRMVNTHKRRAA